MINVMIKNKICLSLALLLIFGAGGCRKKAKNPDASTDTRITKIMKKLKISKQSPESLTPEDLSSKSKKQRDPFVPLAGGAEGSKLTWFTLEGIIWKEEKPLAIINDQIITKGDFIQGAKIVDIKKDGVIILYGGEEIFLPLK